MEFLFAIPLILAPFIIPYITGQMAKSFGRKFWPWFLLAIPLPFVANVILLCLPVKIKKPIEPVASEEIFEHLFNLKSKSKKLYHEQQLPA